MIVDVVAKQVIISAVQRRRVIIITSHIMTTASVDTVEETVDMHTRSASDHLTVLCSVKLHCAAWCLITEF